MLKPLAVYASFAFITIQVTDVVIKRLFFPDWIGTFIVVMILIGFPVTFFLSWIYDITPGGIEKTAHGSRSDLPSYTKNTKKILLPITGTLTIIGGAFWLFYSLGSLSHGTDLETKLFKSIAVLYLDNLSNDRDDENVCAALTQGIITSFSRLELFDIKARTDVVQFRNKIYDHTEINGLLGVDAYLDGSIAKLPNSDEYVANLALVDAQNGNNIWAGEFKRKAGDILKLPGQLVSEVSNALGIENIDGHIVSIKNISEQENRGFSLLGKGINMLDSGKFDKSISVFDTLLKNDPNNRRALYSRGQAFEKQQNYIKAIQDYSSLISEEDQLSKLKKMWQSSDKSFQSHAPLFSKKHNIQILTTQNKETNKINIIALDAITGKENWSWPYRTNKIAASIENDFIVLRTSSFGGKEATVYIHEIVGGSLLFSKEFSKTYDNEIVTISPVEYYHSGWADDSGEDKNTGLIFLNVRRYDNYSIVLIDIATQSIKWEKTFQKHEGKLNIRSLIINDEHYLLQQKGQFICFYRAKDGLILWEKTLESDKSILATHNNRLIYFSQNNPNVKIEEPLSERLVGEYKLDSPGYWWHRFDDNIIMETKKSLTSIKTYKPFIRSIHNWSVILSGEEVFQTVNTLGNNIFALTSENNLYCIDKKSGKVININSLDVFGDIDIYSHTPDQPLVLNIDDFLIGIDPHNGKSLWKIREKDIDDWDDLVAFANNKLFVIKQTHQNEPGMIDIMAYNQTTGDLLWQSNELLYTGCNKNCDYSLHDFENSSIYIKTSHESNNKYAPNDVLYMLNLDWRPDKNYIPKDNLYNQLASCYIKSGDFDKAEDLLTQIVWNIDQQNERAYSQLSNMYLINNNIKNYISTLSNYYDLIKYDNTKKMRLEGALMDHASLQWVENFRKENDIYIDMPATSSVLVGSCENGVGCFLSTFRYETGIQIWTKKYDIVDHDLHIEGIGDEIVLIGRKTPAEQDILDAGFTLGQDYPSNKINMPIRMLRINPKSGEIISDVPFLNQTTENITLWNIYRFKEHTIADFAFSDTVTTVAHNSKRQIVSVSDAGAANWTIEYPEDVFSRMQPIELVNYKDIIIVPLSESLGAINMFDGSHVWEYDYTEEIDDIKYITQSCVKNGELAILSEDDEILLLSLSGGPKLAHLIELDFEEPGRVHYMDTKQIITYNAGGYVGLYNVGGTSFDLVWSKKLGRIYSAKGSEKTICVLDEHKSKIYLVPFNGDKINELPLIWQPDEIFVNNKFIGCYSDRKLYLLSI